MDENFIRKTQVVINQFPLMVMGIDGGPASSPVRRLIHTNGAVPVQSFRPQGGIADCQRKSTDEAGNIHSRS